VRVGVIGTGFVAKLRVQALLADSRVGRVLVAGRSRDRAAEFCAAVGGEPVDGWRSLLEDSGVSLVFVASVNGGRGGLIRSLLEGDRHVVTEYPLALDPVEAAGLIDLAAARGRLLHVEHIELLGGVHRSLKANIKRLGSVAYGRYCTIAPRSPAPDKWTYSPELFGFPLVGALSRVHRLVDVLGPVASVAATMHYGPQAQPVGEFYRTVWCAAQLRFGSGAIAEVLYAKGEGVGPAERRLEMRGPGGALIYDGDAGRWIGPDGTEEPLPVEGRRGLFAVDTAAAIAAIVDGTPLYVSPQESLYTLRVADAARRSAETGRAIAID
jgi:biliverdin reductase